MAGRTKRPKITLVGAGKLGSGLAGALRKAGYQVHEIVSRPRAESRGRAAAIARRTGARAVTARTARFDAPVLWICVTDDAITRTAAAMSRRADWQGRVVFHASGALSSAELEPLRRAGAAVGSLHPMMTFAGGRSAPSLEGVLFGFEGDRAAEQVARRLVRDLKGDFVVIRPENKAVYHAWGAFSSPLMVATLATGELVAARAGIPETSLRKGMRPIVQKTMANYDRAGTAGAFTGPMARGDVRTIARHLEGLRRIPEARAVYVALARAAVELLPVRRRAQLRRLLRQAERGHRGR